MILRWVCENRLRDKDDEQYQPDDENWNLVDENNNILANVTKWNWAEKIYGKNCAWEAYGKTPLEYDEMLSFDDAKKYAENYERG